MKEYKEYKVKNINYDKDGKIRSFDVNIKGANFIVYRLYNKFKPTRIFEFNTFIEFSENKKHSVEIGWDTSTRGLQSLADQTGLRLISGDSLYSIGGKKPYFIER